MASVGLLSSTQDRWAYSGPSLSLAYLVWFFVYLRKDDGPAEV